MQWARPLKLFPTAGLDRREYAESVSVIVGVGMCGLDTWKSLKPYSRRPAQDFAVFI
jgi:hypothetical protein